MFSVESVGTDLFMCLVRIGIRSCTSKSPHTPLMRKKFKSCCFVDEVKHNIDLQDLKNKRMLKLLS